MYQIMDPNRPSHSRTPHKGPPTSKIGPPGSSKHPLAHLACIEIALVACGSGGSCRFSHYFHKVSYQHVQLSATKCILIPPPAFASYCFHMF